MNATKPLHELIPACDLSVFSAAERTRHHQHQQELFESARDTQELAEGYQLTWDTNPDLLEKLRVWVKLETRCCSFLRLEISEQPETFSLSMTGSEVKGVLNATNSKP